MGDFDLANCIRLFKHEENQSSEQPNPDYYAIIPVDEQNIFQEINQPKNNAGKLEDCNIAFSEEGIEELIKFRLELEDLFSDCGNVLGIGSVLWEEISRRFFLKGINVNGKQCSDKWNSLYSKYLQIARCDDEGKILGFRYFAMFEEIYRIRSEFMSSRITEQVILPNYENAPSTDDNVDNVSLESKHRDSLETRRDEEREEDFAIERDFTEMSQENCQANDYQVLKRMIETAEKLLDEDIRKEEDKMMKIGKPRYAAAAVDSIQNDDKRSSEMIEFCWDADSTQCLLDLRLHVESSFEVKRNVITSHKRIGRFLCRQMLINGYDISEYDCKKKWAQLLRCYNKEVKYFRTNAKENNEEVSVGEYFYEMDKVLQKSGRSRSADDEAEFCWTEESVRTLIGIRIKMRNTFFMFKRYIILWQYVATQMAKENFFPRYNECSIKWIELCANYDFCSQAVRLGFFKEGEIKWKFFRDMRHAFEQNAESSESVIGRLGVTNSAKESKSIEIIKEEPVQSSVNVSETSTGKELKISYEQECLEDGNALDSPGAKAESDKHGLEVTGENLEDKEILKNKILDEVQPKTSPSKRNKRFVQSYKFMKKSVSSCEKECNCPKFRWTQDATLSLLRWRLSKELKSRNPPVENVDLWKHIAAQMKSVGYNVCHKSCKSQWYSLKVIRKSERIICKKYSVGSEIPKLRPFKENADATATKATTSAERVNACDNSKAKSRCMWDKRMITILIELKFCKRIRGLKIYGHSIAVGMHAAGYHNITPSECTRKWIGLRKRYNECLLHKVNGEKIRWQHFELMNKYVENLASEVEFRMKNGNSSLDQLPDCIYNLIRLKSSHKEFFVKTEATDASHELEDTTIPTYRNDDETAAVDLSTKVVVVGPRAEHENSLENMVEGIDNRVEKKGGEWNDAATDLLIDLRVEHEQKFPSGYSERSEILWDKIARQMTATGYNFTRAECWQKWCSLRRIYENKIADIEEKRVIQAWPYFGKLDSIYKKLGNIYKGFKWILPKKRTRDDVDDDGNAFREANLSLPKKLIISVLPSTSFCDNVPIPDTINERLKKNCACECLEKATMWC